MEERLAESFAKIERGKVIAAGESGYTVESFGRAGLVTPPIPAMWTGTYTVGQKVYFCLFDDGHGMVIGKLEGNECPVEFATDEEIQAIITGYGTGT